MIVDSSALIAVVKGEPDAEVYLEAMIQGDPWIGAPTLLEANVVARRWQRSGAHALAGIVSTVELRVVAFTEQHLEVARAADRTFGRATGHRAKLNFGDCLAYAVASVERRPLLFKGDDFTHTDIASALDG